MAALVHRRWQLAAVLVTLALFVARHAVAECAARAAAPGDEATVALAAVTLVNVDRTASDEILDALAARLTESFQLEVVVAKSIEDSSCVGDEACACRVASEVDADAVVFVVLTRLGDVLRIDAVTNDPHASRTWEHPAVEISAARVEDITQAQMRALLTRHDVGAREPALVATIDETPRRRRGWAAVAAGLASLGAGAALAVSAARTGEVRRGRAADGFLALGAVSGAAAAVMLFRDRRAARARPQLGVGGARGGDGGVVLLEWTF